MVFKIFSNFDSVIVQIRFPIRAEWIVNTFANFTIERFGSLPPTKSVSSSRAERGSSPICEVMATRTKSWFEELNQSGETTRAGLLLEELRSVKGNGTRTMSPRL